MEKINIEEIYDNPLEMWIQFSAYMGDIAEGQEEAKKPKTRKDLVTQPPIFYVEDLIEQVAKKENWWNDYKCSTSKSMKLPLGYDNGDVTKPAVVEIGDADVHGILVGGTGSGKSFTFYALVDSLGTTFSPNVCRVWLADFKRVTFSQYLPNAKGERLPHMEACICTKDPTYATSFFEGYQKEMRSFAEVMAKNPYLDKNDPDFFTADKLADWNDGWEKYAAKHGQQYLKYKEPRRLLLVDELGAVYAGMDAEFKRRIETALKSIAKEGRAMGYHMLLSSQLPDDINDEVLTQMRLRICLQVSGNPQISNKMIESDLASKITQKAGLGYIKSGSYIPAVSKPVKIAVPMMREKNKDVISNLYKKAVEQNYKIPDLISYDDTDPIMWDQLEYDYNKYAEASKEKGFSIKDMFIYGRLMEFKQDQRLPFNRFYRTESKSNIYGQINDPADLWNTVKLLLWNAKKNDHDVVITTMADESINDYMMVSEMTETPLDILKMSFLEIRFQIKAMLASRIKSGNKKPIWFILIGPDKDVDFGINPDRSIMKDFTTTILQCGNYGMHIAFLNTGKHKVTDSIAESCSTLISDLLDNDDSSAIFHSREAANPSGDLTSNYLVIKDGTDKTRVRLYTCTDPHGELLTRGIKL